MSEQRNGLHFRSTADDPSIATRSARAILPPRRKPYWHPVGTGQHIGYYKGSRLGTWHARFFMGSGRYEEIRLAVADDDFEANGAAILDFEQAIARARKWWRSKLRGRSGGGASASEQSLARQHSAASVSSIEADDLDEITLAWQRERPDLDLGLVGFFLRFERAHHFHERRVAAISSAVGLSANELQILLELRSVGAPYTLRPTDLFKSLLLTSGAVTKRIDCLVDARLAKRVASEDDGRACQVMLTPQGIQVADFAATRIALGFAALREASGMSADEFDAADVYIRRILANMEQVTESIAGEHPNLSEGRAPSETA
jgi:DNA-binding MarR family transcriptional regulator